MKSIHSGAMKFRLRAGRAVSRALLPSAFTIISDDCWGGQIYRQLGLLYTTPTVGVAIGGDNFFRFVRNLRARDANVVRFDPARGSYPCGYTPYAKIDFHHYETEQLAADAFILRFRRVVWNRVLYKIDLEKSYYTDEHIRLWNSLRLPNALALYSERVAERWGTGIYHGVRVQNWTEDGAKLFNQSRKHFDVFKWIRTGKVENTRCYRLLNWLLLDPEPTWAASPWR